MSGEISEVHLAIAKAQGFEVYNTYTEPEAARILGIGLSTLSRIRHRGLIGFISKSTRRVGYFGFHLIDYLLAQQKCPDTPQTNSTKLETIGSPNKPAVLRGAAHGTANAPSKRDVLLCAQSILTKPSGV